MTKPGAGNAGLKLHPGPVIFLISSVRLLPLTQPPTLLLMFQAEVGPQGVAQEPS